MRVLLFCIVLFGLCLPFADKGLSYVEPSFYIIKNISKKHSHLRSGKFVHKISFYDDEAVRLVVNETMIYLDQENALVRITNSDGKEITTRKRNLTRFESDATSRPLFYDLFLMHDYESIYSHLKKLGLPLKTEDELYSERGENEKLPYLPEAKVNYYRFHEQPMIVLRDPSSKSGFQLWVEKESLLPVRAMISDFIEYRAIGYRDYNIGSSRRSLPYPRVVEIYRDEKLWAKIETMNVQLGAKMKFKNSVEKVEAEGDIKQYLDWYFKWVR